jgi:hypothetical protein
VSVASAALLAGSLLSVCWLPVGAAGGGAAPAASPAGFLRSLRGLTPYDLENLERGGMVARVIDTSDRSEILSLAVMRVRTTPARVLERLRRVEGRPREPWVLELGLLGAVPSPRDLETLTLDPGDVKHLAKCRVNDCRVRLSADAIGRFRKEIDWSSPSQAARADALFRETLSAYSASYLSRGDAGLIRYDNNDDPVRIADSLRLLVSRSDFLRDTAPDVLAYMEGFPQGRPLDAEDVLYWMKEKFWLLNVVSLNHAAIVSRGTPPGRLVLAVTKQLYASHYYESSLGATAFVEGPAGSGGYLAFINRSRADIRRSGFNWFERALLKYLVRGRLEGQLKALRLELEGR